jgi:hypothetical protein
VSPSFLPSLSIATRNISAISTGTEPTRTSSRSPTTLVRDSFFPSALLPPSCSSVLTDFSFRFRKLPTSEQPASPNGPVTSARPATASNKLSSKPPQPTEST